MTGFKEIRHTQAEIADDHEFESYLWFLQKLVPGTRFIFLTRNPEDVEKSQWWAGMPNALDSIEATQNRFYSFHAANPALSWLLSYDDIIHRKAPFTELFGWLGTEAPTEERFREVMKIRYAHW